MSRNASAPSASNPSGMSDRRVFSRFVMSSFLISTSPAGPAQREAGGVLARDHADSVSPFRVVMFHCQKLGSTSRFGSMMCPSSSARGCAPMPFSGGPASLLPRSPSLWQLEQVPMKSARPFAASPGFSTSGSSAAMMSPFVLGGRRQRVEERGGLRRDLPVGMRAQPRDVGGAEVRRR